MCVVVPFNIWKNHAKNIIIIFLEILMFVHNFEKREVLMKNFKYILFDLDGTLIDSALGVKNSFKYALEKMNIDIPSDEVLTTFVGPPLEASFKFVGVADENIKNAIEFYRENYTPRGMYEGETFEGIEYVLKKLKEAGKTLIVTTSKVEYLAVKVLEYNKIANYFDYICGSDVEGKRNTKAKVIEYAFERAYIKNRDDAVIVGDTKYDIQGAKEAGIKSLGVFYGYGQNSDIENADYTAVNSYNILDVLL